MTLRVVSPAGTREAMIEGAVLRAVALMDLPFYINKIETTLDPREIVEHFLGCPRCAEFALLPSVRRHFNIIRWERSTFQTHQLIRDNVAHFQPNRLGLRLV